MEEITLKKIDTLLDYLWQASPHNKTKIKESVKAKILELFKENLEGTIRIGDVSEWINYGKERGYNKYLLEDFLKKILPETIIDEDLVCFQTGHQCCILQIKSNASNEGIKL